MDLDLTEDQAMLQTAVRDFAEEVIRPSAEEKRDNPRSSSAKLRFAVRG